VLIATGRPPWPPWRGDQLRARQLVEALVPAHEVTLLAPPGTDEPPLPPGARRETYRARPAALAASAAAPGLLRGWPLQALPFRQPDLGRRLRELAPRHDLVVLQLVRLLPHLADAGGVDLVVDLIDCLSLNAATRAAVDRPWLRPILRLEWRRLARAEARMVAAARTAMVVCERDRAALAALVPGLAGRLLVAPVAVAAASGPGGAPAQNDGPSVLLTGNLGYFPNRDGLRFFLGSVWPALRAAAPGTRLVVAGHRPPAGLARQLEALGGCLIEQPPDLRSLLGGATLAVAPLRCGSGVPLKVLDAWAAGAPVLATPFAAAGAGAEPERELLVASAPAEWVAQALRLLADADLRQRLVEGGRRRLAELAPERVYPTLRRAILGEVTG
jgi:hypothetical protein